MNKSKTKKNNKNNIKFLIDIINDYERKSQNKNNQHNHHNHHNLIKLRLKDYSRKEGEYLIIISSIKKFIAKDIYNDEDMEEDDGKEYIQFDAFKIDYITNKNIFVDKSQPWNFNEKNLIVPDLKNDLNQSQNLYKDWVLLKRNCSSQVKVEDISETITKEEENLISYYENKFLKIGNDEEFLWVYDMMIICTPIYYSKQLQVDSQVKLDITIFIGLLMFHHIIIE